MSLVARLSCLVAAVASIPAIAAAVPRVHSPVGSLSAAGLRAFRGGVSPDGAHLYITELFDDTLDVFRRDAATGKLSFVEEHADDAAGVDGLGGPFDVAVSPDGDHVYVAAVEGAVSVFARDPGSGRLTFVEVVRQGVNGVDGITGAFALTISPDGAHVYVGNREGNTVAVFSRNAATGALTFVEAQRDGVGGVDGLAGVQAIAISSDGDSVYVTGRNEDALAVFSRNPATGGLTFVEVQRDGVSGVDGLYSPQAVTVSGDGAHVYAGSYYDRAVSVFSRDPVTGQLTFAQVMREDSGFGYVGPVSYVTVSPDGANVYSVAYNGVAAVFTRDPGTGMLAFVENHFMGDPQWVGCSPDAAHVYIATEPPGPGYVYAFVRAPATGALSLIERERGFELIPVSMAMTADGAHLYVVNDPYYYSSVAVLSRDAGTGALAPVELYRSTEPEFAMLTYANSVAVSSDGANVYVAGGFAGGSLAVFDRDPATGLLTFVDLEQDGVGGVDGLAFVSAIAVSPDDAHVYAAGPGDDAVAVFSRDAGTGALTFVEVVRDGVGGVDGLSDATSIGVSPDGAHVYVGSVESDAAAFSRNAATGALTYVDKGDLRTGVFGGLVSVSPDGAHVYTRGNGLAAYGRDASTGRLTFIELEAYGVGGVDGFQGRSLFVSADGEMVYAPNSAFARDATSGRLTFVEIPGGLETSGPGSISPDGRHLYFVPFSSVVTLTPYTGCPPTPLTGCDTASSGVLRLTHGARRDKLTWKWRHGTVLPANFGDPTTDTHFAFCVYDESGPPSVVVRALVPAAGNCRVGPISSECWGPLLQYYDRYATPEGVLSIRYVAGDPGEARFTLSAQGEHLTLPALPANLPLRAQLQNDHGACWEATYSAAIVNHAGSLRATAD